MRVEICRENRVQELTSVFEEYRKFCGFSECHTETQEFLRERITSKECIMFVAIDTKTDTIAGFANLYPSYSSLSLQRLWILNDLGVSSQHRKKGVSKLLIKKVKDFASETNAVRIELKTAGDNEIAKSLYSQLQFPVDNSNIYYRVPC